MKLTKKQMTPEFIEARKLARQLGAEAYRNGIRRPHDDKEIIALGGRFDIMQFNELLQAWLNGASKAMFAEIAE